MALTTQEIEIVRKLKAQGKTNREIAGFIGGSRLGQESTPSVSKESLLQDFAGDIGQTITGVKNIATETGQRISEARQAEPEQGKLRGLAQSIGLTAGAAARGFGEVVKGGVKAILSPEQEQAVKGGVEKVATPVVAGALSIPMVQNFIKDYESLDETQKRDVDALFGVGSLATELATAGVGGRGVQAGKKVIQEGVETAGRATTEAIARGAGAVSESGIGNVARGAGTIVSELGSKVARIPSRVATNVAEQRAFRETIEQLPTDIAKQAARDGLDIRDVQTIVNIPKAEKSQIKELVKSVQDFSTGKSKINPQEIVGKPITNAIKRLETQRNSVGAKLGAVADKLGNITSQEVFRPVYDALRRVPGLSGLKVSNKGVLDFSETVLGSVLTKSDQTAIQKIFNEAITTGTGKQKHLLRQSLFEILGGKKKSLTNITDTQERAYEAIRKGLSDVLETKNGQYKTLSNQYRQIVQPLGDLRKFMKNVAGAEEDILDMSAGLLARRLTSNAASNPQLRNILRQVDRALKADGETTLSIENLQDVYNVLDRYYDIAGRTSLQGQVQIAGEKASGGVLSRIAGAAGELAGQTPAVQRQALERLLEETLGL